jgi:hypothetical protein
MDKLTSVVMGRRLRGKTKSYQCVEVYICRSCRRSSKDYITSAFVTSPSGGFRPGYCILDDG